jgi:membrane protease YdiL (CAAX protease family)
MSCAACAAPLRDQASFCASCGHPAGAPAPVRLRARGDVLLVIVFYLLLLGAQGVAVAMFAADADELTTFLVADGLMAALTLATLGRSFPVVWPAYRRVGFGAAGLLLVIAASYPGAVAVGAFVDFMAARFHLTDDLTSSVIALGPGWALVLYCAIPPVVEELAFRGTCYGLLERHLGVRDALLISSFAFALLHLSFVSLVTHIPLGLYFGWLRARSGSLWPAMLAHLLHNGWVLADARYAVLP